MLTTLAIANYRSIRDIAFQTDRLVVVTGKNGSGKSNLYRAIKLMTDIASGKIISSLAAEGGLESTLWAGPAHHSKWVKPNEFQLDSHAGQRRNPISLRLGFGSETFNYAIDLGIPIPGVTLFARDPEIKRECVWQKSLARKQNMMVDRRGPLVIARDEKGSQQTLTTHLALYDSMINVLSDPNHAPELALIRQYIQAWRIYDQLRTDSSAPARHEQIGTRTPVLSESGHNLAAALQTIIEIGDEKKLETLLDDAFPGSKLEINCTHSKFSLSMHQPGLLRPLHVSEWSEGTLRYVLLLAALLSPRPPSLLVLNEPELNLHTDLLPALSKLIIYASEYSQIIVVTHTQALSEALIANYANQIILEKYAGETRIKDGSLIDWEWPTR